MKISNFKKKLTIIFFGFFLDTSAFANNESIYTVVKKTDVYEIRFYPERLVVESIYNSTGGTFRKLFNYISGANNTSEKIEMTTPVTQIKKIIKILCNLSFRKDLIKKQFPFQRIQKLILL